MSYNFKISEKQWQDFWEERSVYKYNEKDDNSKRFVIDTPPPTVSGHLHMGHVFSFTQGDFIARYKRMKGYNVYYPIGFDDNGLPTERLVEKSHSIKASAMDRGQFVKLCRETVGEYEEEFANLFKSLALSFDWGQKYQTISPSTTRISQASFIDLINKGRIYRRFEPTIWDPADKTALAQADLEDKEQKTMMNYISFEVMDSNGVKSAIEIMTTRPELLVCCVALVVNPDDQRYKHLIGGKAITALFKVEVPIIGDEAVDSEKGTGLVMCCTFGDSTDIEWWKKHKLLTRVALDKNGQLNNFDFVHDVEFKTCLTVKELQSLLDQIKGLTVKPARQKVLEILGQTGELIRQEEKINFVKCAERSGAPIEFIITPQWFIKLLDIKEELIAKAEQLSFHPSYMRERLIIWIKNLSWDWCISRQRFFGVPFPIWYSKRSGEEGKILMPEITSLPVDPLHDLPKGYSREEIDAEVDVMDTWATSSLTPQISSQGISKEISFDRERHDKLFPADLRLQSHEIIRTWAFYTLAKAHIHQNNVPWKDLMISGWCLASNKEKMSKSKGNIVEPKPLVEENSADAVRYWASTSHLGTDTAFSPDAIKIGKKLVNKIYNAANFISPHFVLIEQDMLSMEYCLKENVISETVDKWIIIRALKALIEIEKEFEKYEYAKAREILEKFFWNDFCDNYLEIVKVRQYGLAANIYKDKLDQISEEEKKKIGNLQLSSTCATFHVLFLVLKGFAPILPHITEEIYQNLFALKFGSRDSIHKQDSWPKFPINVEHHDKVSEVMDSVVEVIEQTRKFKSDNNLSLKTELSLIEVPKKIHHLLDSCLDDLKNVTNSHEIRSNIKSKEEYNFHVILDN